MQTDSQQEKKVLNMQTGKTGWLAKDYAHKKEARCALGFTESI